jgi:hypothetical protein
MPAELREDQKLRRVIKVYGIEGAMYVTLDHQGITFTAPGTKVGVSLTWVHAVESCLTPSNVPSKFEGRPMEFLIDQAAKQSKRAETRAEKKESNEAQV